MISGLIATFSELGSREFRKAMSNIAGFISRNEYHDLQRINRYSQPRQLYL